MAEYRNPAHFGKQGFEWDPGARIFSGGIQETAAGYLPMLMQYRDMVRAGTAKDYEAEQYRNWEAAARAIPTRDIGSLTSGWQGDLQGGWGDEGWREGSTDWWSRLDPMSPDVGPIMLQLREKLEAGTATPQERELYSKTMGMASNWDWRASTPQASDAFNPMGDNLMGALGMLAIGASGGLAAAPLAAGAGLTLGGAAGLLGTAGSITGMLAEPLDSKAMRMAGLAMGVAGGATSIASLLSSGLNSVGDVIKAVQKVYGTGTKAMGLINAAKAAADNPAALAQAQRQAGSTSPSRAVGSTSGASGGTGGGAVAEAPGILSQLGPLLGGLVGMAGAGMSMYQIEQYTQQLKDKYGQQEETKKLIDEAYKLALARYETYYARNEKEYEQKQAAYQDQLAKYQDTYSERQHQWYQEQDQFRKIEGQTDEDRRIEQENHYANRQMVNEDYNRRVAEAQQERDFQLSEHGADRRLVLESYNRRVQEADQDRQKQVQAYDQQFGRHTTREDQRAAQAAEDRAYQQQNYGTQFGRHMSREDQRAAQAAEERDLDLTAYQQRQAIGADLRDPAKLAAGAQAVYSPLSAAARDRINVQAEEEMARRGVAGGGQYSNLMAAKAFAPQEAQLWQNAMQNYMAGQTGALSAYTQQDMTMAPEYRWAQRPEFTQTPAYSWGQRPEFTSSPEYRQMTIPNLAGSPGYNPLQTPNFTNSQMQNVPKAPTYNAQYPGVPDATEATDPPGVPGSSYGYYPTPYGGGEGGGAGGTAGGIQKLVGELTKAFGTGGAGIGAIQAIIKMMTGGGGYNVDPNQYDYPIGPYNVDPNQYDYPIGPDQYTSPYDYTYTPDYSYDYNPGGMENVPYYEGNYEW